MASVFPCCAGQIPCHRYHWYSCNTLAACRWSEWPTRIADCGHIYPVSCQYEQTESQNIQQFHRRRHLETIDRMKQNQQPCTATYIVAMSTEALVLVSSGNIPPPMSMPLGNHAILNSGHGLWSEATTKTEQSRVARLTVTTLIVAVRVASFHYLFYYRCCFTNCESRWLTPCDYGWLSWLWLMILSGL